MTTIGDRLKELRLKRNLTQHRLAKRAGIHVTALRYYEYGLRCPSVDNLRKLCKALKVSLWNFDDVAPFQKRKTGTDDQVIPDPPSKEAA